MVGAVIEGGRQVISGEWDNVTVGQAARNIAKLGVAAGAGATGAGLANVVATGVRAAGARGVAAVTLNATGNAVAGASINAAVGLVNDVAIGGQSLDAGLANVRTNATNGAVGGALGSLGGQAVDAALTNSSVAGANGTITVIGQRIADAIGDTVSGTVTNSASAAAETLSQAPLVPNGGSVPLPPQDVPTSADFGRNTCERSSRREEC